MGNGREGGGVWGVKPLTRDGRARGARFARHADGAAPRGAGAGGLVVREEGRDVSS